MCHTFPDCVIKESRQIAYHELWNLQRGLLLHLYHAVLDQRDLELRLAVFYLNGTT